MAIPTPKTTLRRLLRAGLLLLVLLPSIKSFSPASDPNRLSPLFDSIHPESATTTSSNPKMSPAAVPVWFQHKITVTAPRRGCHLITNDILKAAGSDIRRVQIGLCHLFVQHTSASLTINENADPDVRTDLETALNRIVPASWNRDGSFRHTMEGDDDMPGHCKSSLMGVSLQIPISHGQLALGTWQGVYLNEHRDQGGWGGGHSRNIVITIQGQATK